LKADADNPKGKAPAWEGKVGALEGRKGGGSGGFPSKVYSIHFERRRCDADHVFSVSANRVEAGQ